MGNIFGVKWVVMIRDDENLNLPGLLEEFKDYGEVFEIQDEMLDEEIPVKLIYLDGGLDKFITFKWYYNCIEAPSNEYFLIPMENLKEKALAMM